MLSSAGLPRAVFVGIVALLVAVVYGACLRFGFAEAWADVKLVAGVWSEFETVRDAAVVGQALARRRGLNLGQRFSIGEVTVKVAGIYTASQPAEENFLYTGLEFLQRTRGLNSVGTVTQFEALLAPRADADQVAHTIDNTFRGGPIQTDTRTKGAFQANAVADLAQLIGLARYLGFACVGLVLALVGTTTVMAVQDRIREHAVLQTLGFSGPRIFGLVLCESVLLSLLGGLAGIGTALIILTWSSFAAGTEGITIAFVPSLGMVGIGLAVTVIVGVLAGLVPAWQASRAEIIASLRSV